VTLVNDYTVSGSNEYSVPFDYLQESHVAVYVGPSATAITSDPSSYKQTLNTAYQFKTTSTIEFKAGYLPTGSQVVRVSRETPSTAAIVDFQDGSVLTESDLDTATRQALYVSGEVAAQGQIDKDAIDAKIDAALGDDGTAPASPQVWTFTGDGSDTTFAVTGALHDTDEYFIVSVNGLLQDPSSDFSVSSEVLTFTTAPAAAADIVVQNFGRVRNIDNATTIADGAVVSADLNSSLGVTAAGGDTERSFIERFGDFVNVKDYGATGVGTDDQTTDIQQAITAAAGKVIYFPPGTYKVTSDITISSSATVLRGDGPSSVLKMNNCSLIVDATSATVSDVQIQDMKLTVEGTIQNTLELTGDANSDFTVDRFRMRNTIVENSAQTNSCVKCDSVNHALFLDCTFTAGDVAVDANPAANDYGLRNTAFMNCTFDDNVTAVDAIGHQSLTFLSCAFLNTDEKAIYLRDAGKQCSVISCFFNDDDSGSTTDAFIVAGQTGLASPVTSVNLTISGCRFVDGGGTRHYAITLNRMLGATIDGCRFEGILTAGIYNNPEAADQVTGRFRESEVEGATPLVAYGSLANSDEFQPAFPRVIAFEENATLGLIRGHQHAPQDTFNQDLAVTGARVGDMVIISVADTSMAEMNRCMMSSHVSEDDTVRVKLRNASATDIAAGETVTFRGLVISKDSFTKYD